jgi:ribosome-binding factor A
MKNTQDMNVRREQKKAFLLREISSLLLQIQADHPELLGVFPTKVELSSGKTVCDVFFASIKGHEGYVAAVEVLKLYRPSIKRAIAGMRQWRKMPDLRFHFDVGYDKGVTVNELLDKVSAQDSEISSLDPLEEHAGPEGFDGFEEVNPSIDPSSDS